MAVLSRHTGGIRHGSKVVIVEPDSEMGLMVVRDKLDKGAQRRMVGITAEAYQRAVQGSCISSTH